MSTPIGTRNYILEAKTHFEKAIVTYKTNGQEFRYIPSYDMSSKLSNPMIEGCLTQADINGRMSAENFQRLMRRILAKEEPTTARIFIIAALHGDFDLFNDLVTGQGLDDRSLPLPADHKSSPNYKPADGSDTLPKFLRDQYLVLAPKIEKGVYNLGVHSATSMRYTLEVEDDTVKWHGIEEEDMVEHEAEAGYQVDIHEDFMEGFGSQQCFAMSVFAEDPYPVERPDDSHLLAGFWWQGKYHLLTMLPGTSDYSPDEEGSEAYLDLVNN